MQIIVGVVSGLLLGVVGCLELLLRLRVFLVHKQECTCCAVKSCCEIRELRRRLLQMRFGTWKTSWNQFAEDQL